MMKGFMGVLEPKTKILIATATGYQILFLSLFVLPYCWIAVTLINTIFWSAAWMFQNEDKMDKYSLLVYGFGLIGGTISGSTIVLHLSITASSG